MITFKSGNMFNENVQAIVNPVNCVGVMGAGLAKQFKELYPTNFQHYKKACDKQLLRPGSNFLTKLDSQHFPQYIINFATKGHWRDYSRLEYIEKGLQELVNIITSFHIESIAIPALGCGLGGLNWSDVKSLMIRYLSNLEDIHIVIFELK